MRYRAQAPENLEDRVAEVLGICTGLHFSSQNSPRLHPSLQVRQHSYLRWLNASCLTTWTTLGIVWGSRKMQSKTRRKMGFFQPYPIGLILLSNVTSLRGLTKVC